VVSRALSALCMYSKFTHHPHPPGYLCAKFCFFCGLHCRASPYSLTYSSSLFDALRNKVATRKHTQINCKVTLENTANLCNLFGHRNALRAKTFLQEFCDQCGQPFVGQDDAPLHADGLWSSQHCYTNNTRSYEVSR